MTLGVAALVLATGGAAGAAVTLTAPAPGGQHLTTSGITSAPRPAQRPLLAVVGASFSAGVGAGHPDQAWPQDLARIMHWRLALSADPGAGYVNPGAGDRGPFAKLAGPLHLARTDPSAIIIQGGHDDIGRPLPLIRARVESLIASVHRECPRSRLAVLTVFPRGIPTPATKATDQAIVAAARQADPAIIVFNPITGHWHFPRIGDHLHPTPAGHEWIAHQLAGGLRADGVLDRATSLSDRARAASNRARAASNRAPGTFPGRWLNAQPDPG
jgi:lysophospholipase L1-like esterase